MPTLVPYKGLSVPDTTTGDGGTAIKANFQNLVTWGPKSRWDAAVDPTNSDDGGDDFYPGSMWLNATDVRLFLCVDNATGAAQWQYVPTVPNTAPPGEGAVLFAGPSGGIASDAANLFWDAANARLGIGTDSPAAPLHYVGVSPIFDVAPGFSGDVIVNVRKSSNSAGLVQFVWYWDTNICLFLGGKNTLQCSGGQCVWGNDAGTSHYFVANASPAMTILTSGHVLIGTTQTDDGSGALLQVQGTAKADKLQIAGMSSAPPSPVAGQIYYNSSSNHFFGYDGSTWKQLDN